MSIPGHMVQDFCIECGCEFWMPRVLDRQFRLAGPERDFCCPSGHKQFWEKSHDPNDGGGGGGGERVTEGNVVSLVGRRA